MKVFLLRFFWFFCAGTLFAFGNYKIALGTDYDKIHRVRAGFQASLSFAEIRLFPQYEINGKGFGIKNWSVSVFPFKEWKLSVGNIFLSGIFSRFSNPSFSTSTALKGFGASQAGLTVSYPSFSSSETKTFSAVNSLYLGGFRLHVGGRLQKEAILNQLTVFSFPFFTALEYSFSQKSGKWRSAAALRGMVSFLGGHTILQGKEESSWFAVSPYFAPISVHYALAELTLKNNIFELFTSNGYMEYPLGGAYFFTRNEFSVRFWYMMLNAAFSFIDSGYIGSSGTIVRQSINAQLNPQINFPLNRDGTIKLRTGFLGAFKYRQSADRKARETLVADFKTMMAFSSRFFNATAEYRITGCDAAAQFAPVKETVQTVAASVQYRSAALKPRVVAEAGIKHESYPFFYANNLEQAKIVWGLSLKTEVRIITDIKITASAETLFKKDGNDYTATLASLYMVSTKKTKTEIGTNCSFEYKTTANRLDFTAGIKYVFQFE